MEYNEIEAILKQYLEREDAEFDKPTEQEWDELANITGCKYTVIVLKSGLINCLSFCNNY